MSMVRVKSYKVGDMIPVEPVPGGYPLPEGLPAGAVVRVVEFVHAYRVVEWEGKQFTVYMANMQPGFEPVARLTGKYRGLMWRILRRQGFLMPGRRATVTAALEWLAVNPCPRKRK